jgi:hypothetical protein
MVHGPPIVHGPPPWIALAPVALRAYALSDEKCGRPVVCSSDAGNKETEMKELSLLYVALSICIAPLTRAAEETSGLFPLGEAMADGEELPLPLGIGASFHYQDQSYSLSRMAVSLPNVDLSQAASVDIDNELIEGDVTIDLWLLPFLNVFGLVGAIDGRTDVDLSSAGIGSLRIDYDGIVYGAGATLAGSVDNVFASFTALYTDTDLDQGSSSVSAWVLTPRVGVTKQLPESDRQLALWIGAMYQQTDEEHSGTIAAAQLGTITYDVELEEDTAWNALVGVSAELTDHWNLDLEVGGGDRSQVTATVTCRF